MTMDEDPVVWLNGRFLRASRASVGVLDRGLLYGDALFETWRTYSGRPFAVSLHLERLAESARRIALPVPDFDWEATGAGLLERNGLAGDDAAVRLTVTRGRGAAGLLPPSRPRPTALLTCRPVDPALIRLRRTGVTAAILPFSPGLDGVLQSVKTTAYLPAILGKVWARGRGAFEGLYSTERGEILEGATSNVFVVESGRLLTPPATRGVLPGVTRSLVIEIARHSGIRVAESRLTVDRLRQADEAFLTATSLEVMPIRAVVPSRTRLPVGPVTRRLRAAYALLRPATERPHSGTRRDSGRHGR